MGLGVKLIIPSLWNLAGGFAVKISTYLYQIADQMET